MTASDSASKTPSLIEIWKVLTQIKTNTEKLVLDVDSFKGNDKELKETSQKPKDKSTLLSKKIKA